MNSEGEVQKRVMGDTETRAGEHAATEEEEPRGGARAASRGPLMVCSS